MTIMTILHSHSTTDTAFHTITKNVNKTVFNDSIKSVNNTIYCSDSVNKSKNPDGNTFLVPAHQKDVARQEAIPRVMGGEQNLSTCLFTHSMEDKATNAPQLPDGSGAANQGVSAENIKQIYRGDSKSPTSIIQSHYPECNICFFDEVPNNYDKKYITGTIRKNAQFLFNYEKEKAESTSSIRRLYSGAQLNFRKFETEEVNTATKSWATVISGERPVGQFSVTTLYSPELHALLSLPNISAKIFKKENNDFLFIVVVYRNDYNNGELLASRFIELYDKKREIMSETEGDQVLKVIESEKVVAKVY